MGVDGLVLVEKEFDHGLCITTRNMTVQSKITDGNSLLWIGR